MRLVIEAGFEIDQDTYLSRENQRSSQARRQVNTIKPKTSELAALTR